VAVADRNLQHPENLLFSSALANSELAIESWSKLVSLVHIEDLPSESRHWLPLVYVNLSRIARDQDFPHRERLRVSYRSTFLANSRRLSHLRPLLEMLDTRGLTHTLVKGMGVALRCGHLGIRTMGDCDLLVERDRVREVLRVCEDLSYRPWSRQAGKHHLSQLGEGWRSIGPWADRDGFIVDIHLPENFECGAFHRALQTSAQTERTSFVSVPDATSLALLSILHGLESSGKNDRVNSVIDFAALQSHIDISRFTQSLTEWNMTGVPSLFISDLPNVNGWLDARMSPDVLPKRMKRQQVDRSQVAEVCEILWLRRPHFREVWRILRSARLRRARYLAWILFGRVARVEAKFAQFGGFLRDDLGQDLEPWCDQFEIRWKIRARIGSRMRIRIVDTDSKGAPRVVAVSGHPFGLVPWEGLNQIELQLPRPVQEVVIRSVDGDRCFRDSDHTLFQLEFLDD